jgi:hypothetical protein
MTNNIAIGEAIGMCVMLIMCAVTIFNIAEMTMLPSKGDISGAFDALGPILSECKGDQVEWYNHSRGSIKFDRITDCEMAVIELMFISMTVGMRSANPFAWWSGSSSSSSYSHGDMCIFAERVHWPWLKNMIFSKVKCETNPDYLYYIDHLLYVAH